MEGTMTKMMIATAGGVFLAMWLMNHGNSLPFDAIKAEIGRLTAAQQAEQKPEEVEVVIEAWKASARKEFEDRLNQIGDTRKAVISFEERSKCRRVVARVVEAVGADIINRYGDPCAKS
jgi:hypothetical protein